MYVAVFLAFGAGLWLLNCIRNDMRLDFETWAQTLS